MLQTLVNISMVIAWLIIQNVWPLIYKSSFSPHTASPLLLLSMLSISACISAPSPGYGHDANKLFGMAESALYQRRDNGIDIIQSLILLSMRQTGCGDKGSAFIYAGRACAMVLNSGLNLARKDADPDSVGPRGSYTKLIIQARRASPIACLLELLRCRQNAS